MKARNREINIFNMSLLDVLCGALGAFCFMMLVLFPYYKPKQESATPPGPPPQNCEDCMQKHDEMRKKIEETNARNAQLEMRNPFVVEMFPRYGGFDIDLYINDDRKGGQNISPKPDATKPQGEYWTGDKMIGGRGAYPEIWMVRDAPKGDYRVYYKVMKMEVPNAPPTFVEGRVMTGGGAVLLPKVVLGKVGEVVHVGTITSDGDGGFSVKAIAPDKDLDQFLKERDELAARQAQRENEQKKQPEQKKP